ncbi:MAG TPA: ABC transporter substrate-binding protein, partial [Tepidiformaceae bacterium]|nr:ABC transporter substrate-binding protein [Tepidiformaceae bacterium]
MADGYWERYARMRSGRRRFVAGSGMAGLGAAGLALVGCGDDDDEGGDATAAPTQAGAQPTAAEKPKVGGTARYPIFGISSGDPPTLYPYENISYQVQTISGYHYSRLLRGASGPDIGITEFPAVEGDLAQKLPEQPDNLTYIFKLKPNITFHDKAPMNGRAATAQDFAATWDFFKAQAINRARFDAVIDKLEATDATTIKITLKAPNAPFITNGAASDQGIWFIPIETINNDQYKSDPVGSGPFLFRAWESGVRMAWDRHPKWYDGPKPYFDGIEAAPMNDIQRRLV